MAYDLIAIRPSEKRDPDGSKLREVLNSHLALERARSSRVVWVHAMAGLSIPVWLACLWPSCLSGTNRRLLLGGWAMVATMVLLRLVAEWRWRLRRDSYAEGLRGDLPPAP
jgi:hypothetical protein